MGGSLEDLFSGDTFKQLGSGVLDPLFFPSANALELKIEEGISDYERAIRDVSQRSAETQIEAGRKQRALVTEGSMALREQGAQAAFEGRMAMTQAEMVASSEEARLGGSGVRAVGSPLLAAQQNVDLASAAADRRIESGNAGMALGGFRLGSTLQDIGAQSSLLTAEYRRKQNEMLFKRYELRRNKESMVGWAKAGSAIDFTSSFFGKSAGGL